MVNGLSRKSNKGSIMTAAERLEKAKYLKEQRENNYQYKSYLVEQAAVVLFGGNYTDNSLFIFT